MIEEVVARRDARKHLLNALGGLAFISHAFRARARQGLAGILRRDHVFADAAFAAISGSSANARATTGHGTPRSHSVLPMPRARTQCTLPPRDFLSPATMPRSCDLRMPASGGSGPTLVISRMMREASASGVRF